MYALADYRYQFEGVNYSPEQFVQMFGVIGNHCDIGGGYGNAVDANAKPILDSNGQPIPANGISSLTFEAADQFLAASGLTGLAEALPTPNKILSNVTSSNIYLHVEITMSHGVPWPNYAPDSFNPSAPAPRRWASGPVVQTATQVATPLGQATQFQLFNDGDVSFTKIQTTTKLSGGGYRVQVETSAPKGYNSYLSKTVITGYSPVSTPAGPRFLIGDVTNVTNYSSTGVYDVKVEQDSDNCTVLIPVDSKSDTLTVAALSGKSLSTDTIAIETSNAAGAGVVLVGGTASGSSSFGWVGADGKTTYTFVSYGANHTGTLQVTGGVLGGTTLNIKNFDLSKAQSKSGYLGIKLSGGLAVTAGTSNPFQTASVGPGDVTVNASQNTQTFTVSSTADSSVARTVQVALAGATDASKYFLNEGVATQSFAAGSIAVTIPAGETSATFGLVYAGTSTAGSTPTLTASMDDGSGNTISSNQFTVNYSGLSAAPTDLVAASQGAQFVDRNYNPFYYINPSMDIPGYSPSNTNVLQASGSSDTDFNSAGSNEILVGYNTARVESSVGNDTIYGGFSPLNTSTANDTITGGGAPDVILLASGNNQIYRRNGVNNLQDALAARSTATATGAKGDFISVLDGNNTIVGGDGNNLIDVGEGNNTIVMGQGQNIFMGGMEDYQASSSWSTSALDWKGSSDILINNVQGGPGAFNAPAGYEGAHVDVGTLASHTSYPLGTGNDTIYGGTGNSIYYLANGNNYIDAGGGNDSIWASTGSSTIYGGSGSDIIYGGGGNNYINCESGNDTVINEGGNSTIYGGTGNQLIYSGEATNFASSHTDAVSYMEAGSGNTQLFGSAGHDTLVGGSGSDQLHAGDGQELLQAGSGQTTMFGGAGQDTLVGGSGQASIYGGTGAETITGGSGADSIIAGSGATSITGGSGVDSIWGGSGDTNITGGDGGTDGSAVNITAGTGNTTIHGGSGVNLIQGGSGTNLIYAGDGGDAGQATQVTAGSGPTTIYGGAGIDRLIAGSGSDYIVAGDGGTSDNYTTVEGGSGNSTIVAGAGYDAFFGGAGSTTYVVGDGAGTVVIANSNSGDVLQFSDGTTASSITASETVNSDGTYVGLTLDGGRQIVIAPGGLSQVMFADGTQLQVSDFFSNKTTSGSATFSYQTATLQQSTDTSVATQHSLTVMGTQDAVATGNDVDDVLTANFANDTLVAGSANNTLVGGGASDCYVVSAGAGTTTTISNSTAADVIEYTSSVRASDLTATASQVADGSLQITLTSAKGGSVVVNQGTNVSTLGSVDAIAFADGSTTSLYKLLAASNVGATATTSSVSGALADGLQNLTLTGSGDLIVAGNDLDNVITANLGHDTLVSGTAEDTLVGGGGTATYVVESGNGVITILDSGSADTLQYGEGINETDLDVSSTVVGGVSGVELLSVDGRTVDILGGALQNVDFSDGGTATIAELLANSYNVGDTTFARASTTAGAGIQQLAMTGNADVVATGNTLDDVISSNYGNDTLVAGSGNDTLIGGGMSDAYQIGAGSGPTTTIENSSDADTLSFGIGISEFNLSVTTITASDGSAIVTVADGVGGSVVIDAQGTQILDNISFADGSTLSLAQLEAADDLLRTTGTSAISLTLPADVSSVTLTGASNLVAVGNALADTITANSGNDTLIAGSGLATLIGGSGNDTFVVTNAADSIVAGTGNSTEQAAISVTLADGVHQMVGTGSANISLSGNSTRAAAITANAGNDTLTAGTLGDTLISGTGVDTLIGGTGNDTFVVNNASDVVDASSGGRDVEQTSVSTTSGTGIAELDGTGSANLVLTDGQGYGRLVANSGNDTLVAGNGTSMLAGSGNDTLIVGAGDYATLYSGSGSTTYVIDSAAAGATINAGANDVIQLGSGVTLDQVWTVDYGNGNILLETPTVTASFSAPLASEHSVLRLADGSQIAVTTLADGSFISGQSQYTTTSATLQGGLTSLTLQGGGLSGTANDLDDVLRTGVGGNDTLVAGIGNDTLVSGVGESYGNNTLVGGTGAGSTTYNLNATGATIVGSRASDTLELGVNFGNLTSFQNYGWERIMPVLQSDGSVTLNFQSILTGTWQNLLTIDVGSTGYANNIQFADGSTTSIDYLLQHYYSGGYYSANASSVILPYNAVVANVSYSGAMTVTANSLDDFLEVQSGDATVIGGSGADTFDLYDSGSVTIQQASDRDTLEWNNVATGSLSASISGSGSAAVVTLTAADAYVSGITYTVQIDGAPLSMEVVVGSSESTLGQLLGIAPTVFSSTSIKMASGVSNLTLTGTADLTATGNNLSDVITANSGNDTLISGATQSTLIGGAGNDVFVVNNASDVITEAANGGNDTEEASFSIAAAANIENLTALGSASLTLTGNNLSGVLTANSGFDTLVSGTGVDTLVGSGGYATFVVNNAADVIVAGTGVGSEESSVSTTLATNVGTLTGIGYANLVLTSNAQGGVITANAGNDTLVAGSGSDTLQGPTSSLSSSVQDVMVAGTGAATTFNVDTNIGSGQAAYSVVIQGARASDTLELTGGTSNVIAQSVVENGVTDVYLYAGNGTSIELVGGSLGQVNAYGTTSSLAQLQAQDPTTTSSVSLTMAAGTDNLVLTGSSALTATGNASNDVMRANSGGDTLIAGSGAATLIGGSGNDTFVVDNTADVIVEQSGAGIDTEQTSVSAVLAANVENLTGTGSNDLTLQGNAQANVITANSGNDQLFAGTGPATLVGGSGADTLTGGRSATTLIAGTGVTDLQGESGNDTFILGTGSSTSDWVSESVSGNNVEESAVSTTLAYAVQRLAGLGTSAIRLTGNSGGGSIAANGGNDTLSAGGGTSTLIGGGGTDVMMGNASAGITAATVYQINTGYGNTTIYYSESGDELVFGSGITAGMLSATQGTGTVNGVANQTIITIKVSGGNSITLAAPAFTQVGFADGSSTTLAAIVAQGSSVTSAVSTTMGAGVTKLTLTGTANISGTGNNLADTIIANSGNDTLIAGSGLATLVGGSGNDTFVVNNVADVIQEAPNSGNNTEQTSVSVTLASNIQNLTATAGTTALTLTGNSLNDVITANSGADKLVAGSGADTLVSGTGIDTLVGGTGNDVFVVNNASDVITEAANSGNNTEQTSVSVTLANNVQNLTAAAGTTALTLTGNTLNNVITANSGADKLVAGSGLDTLVSGTGIDTLVGGTGNDVFVVNNASDVITKSANTGSNTEQASVSLTLAANVQNLTGIGSAALSLTGNSLANVITANSGNDTLVSGTGADTILGGAGNYTVNIGAESDTVTLGSGNDTIVSAEGSSNAETMHVGDGNDVITLGTGTDQVTLGNGVDTINVKGGTDTITLGTGQYVINSTGGVDNVVLTNGAENKLWFEQVGNNLQINVLGTTEQVTVSNWFTTGTKLNQLTSSDGHTINAAGIGQLVQAMAAFAAPTSAQTAYTAPEQTALAPVLAANWH